MLFAAVHESDCGTSRTLGDVRLESAKRAKTDIDQVAVAILLLARSNDRNGSTLLAAQAYSRVTRLWLDTIEPWTTGTARVAPRSG
jgi:hypothetical protein